MKYWRVGLMFGLELVGMLAASAQTPAPQLRLQENAEIHRETILLSDLLPGSAPAALQAAASVIELGKAPQPGSLRAFDPEQIRARLAGHAVLASQISLPSRIIVEREASPISRQTIQQAVASFLQQRGWAPNDLPLAASLQWTHAAALVERPVLEVDDAGWDNRRQRLQLRLRCQQPSLCGSFLVSLPSPSPASTASLTSVEARPQPPIGQATVTSPQIDSRVASKRQPDLGRILMQPGDSATLILESGRIRISLPVICLQRGALHQEIRVRDASGSRIYHAQVAGVSRLRAVF